MSDPDLHARASALFLELRELPAAGRARALAARTGADERLRSEVESLFEHDATDTPEMPDRIGPYRILGRIGSGGSGQVLLGEQDEPVRRRVAIKVVPAAALSPELAARFDVERRALETTEHPHIARILDTGRTRDGLPYLVMDYIEGQPITDYCTARELSLAERVRLMLPVADALQHAHQRGVVHRDVKPANVLVSERDGTPVPHLLDFGIAKPVAGAIAQTSPATLGAPLGTPAYMAPEQTGLGTVDARADVYGFGAVLYELATGAPPIEVTRSADADPLEVLLRIREQVPPPASRVRAAELGPAPRALLADLDAILAQALEKDPERRYPTLDACAADLRRMLAREPIEARPPSWGYLTARFVERNRALVAACGLALGALVLGFIGLATGLREARAQGRQAEREWQTQREINRFLTDDLLLAASPDQAGADVTAIQLLDRASRRIDDRFPERPLVAASIHQALAAAYAELGEYDASERHVARALALRIENAGANSPDAVRSEILQADLVARRERYEEAAATFLPLIARARLILGPDDPDLYLALNDLGVCLESLGQLDEAQAALEEALVARRRLLEPHDREILISMGNLALVYERQGDVERSIQFMEEALAIAEAAPEPPRLTILILHNNLGATYQDLDRDEEAVPYLRRASEMAAETLGPEHPGTISILLNAAGLEAELGDPERALELYEQVTQYRTELLGPEAEGTLIARYGYWDSMQKAARPDEAQPGFEELLADCDAALGENHWLSAQTMVALANVFLQLDLDEDALALAQEAELRMQQAYGPGHERTRSTSALIERIRQGLAGDSDL